MSLWTSIRGPLEVLAGAAAIYFTGGAAAGWLGAAEGGAAAAGGAALAGDAALTAGGTAAGIDAGVEAGLAASGAVGAGAGATSAAAATGAAATGGTSILSSVGGGLSAAAPYVGAANGVLGYLGAQQQNSAAAAQAQQQEAFQASQTGTAYQRAVKDMEAAGLNPMLAYSQGGAASGAGAQAPVVNALGAGSNSGFQAMQALGTLENTFTQNRQIEASAANLDSNSNLNYSNAALNLVQAKKMEQEISSGKTGQDYTKSLTANVNASIPGTRAASDLATSTLPGAQQKIMFGGAQQQTEAELSAYQLNAARAGSNAANTWFGQNVSPWIPSALQGANFLKNVRP